MLNAKQQEYVDHAKKMFGKTTLTVAELKKANSKFGCKYAPQWLIKNKDYKTVLNIATKAHKALNCKGVTRADFKFFKNKFYLLEINTQPGMTGLSLVPEIANYVGITFPNLIEKILLDASTNR